MSDNPFDPDDAYEQGGYLPPGWKMYDGTDTDGSPYVPEMVDHLLPGELGIPLHPVYPMFRYQMMLTLKDDSGVSGSCTNQHSWPVDDVPRLIEEAGGGLDLFLRAKCRLMVGELTESLFPEGRDPPYPTMRYTGRFYVSGHIPPGMDTQPGVYHPTIATHELAVVSMVGDVMGCIR